MFEQHPVPQQISSYQFRLVGDMTLKQFFQLAAGAVVGLILYSLPLPGFFKWPLIALVVIGGAAFAFLPIQDRPLEQWLVAFFRSIYAPTILVWKKPEKPAQYFALDNQAVQPAIPAEEIPEEIPQDVATQALEQNEQNFLGRISSMFAPSKFHAAGALPNTGQVPDDHPEPPKESESQLQQKPRETQVAPVPPVQVKPQGFAPLSTPPVGPVVGSPVGQVFGPGDVSTGTPQVAKFSSEAAPPDPPTQPNVAVGQVMDVNGKIVEGAILEISDSEGRPVRALKTNKAGHFMIVTPLSDGEYKITTEKEGLEFEPVTIVLTGTIVTPIAVKSKNALPEPPELERRAEWSP
jgi:hypothetical protein